MIWFLWERGLSYTKESKRDMETVAAADCKRKEPKVARLACLTLVKTSGRGKRRLLHFLSKKGLLKQYFFVMDTLQPGEKTLLEVHYKKDICI